MTRWQRVFRYVWRVNAVLILVAAGAVTFGVGALLIDQLGARSARFRESESGPLVEAAASDPRLFLGQAAVVAGSRFMRAELMLHREGGGFSSGGYAETRNVLLIDPDEKEARWLLADDDHVVAESHDVLTGEGDAKPQRTVATVVLVKKVGGDLQTEMGRLLLFGPSGKNVVEVSEGVRALHVATLSDQQVTVLYERDRQLVAAAFDADSLARQREQIIGIPPFK